jgi:pilus assembly protein TadC
MDKILGGLRSFLIAILGPAATSQISIFVLAGFAIALVLALYFMPTLEEMVARANFGVDRTRLSSRMIRQAQALRPTRENRLRDQIRDNVYRGGRRSDVMETSGDFFLFLRILCAVAFGTVGAFYVLVLNAPIFYLAVALLGYLAPLVYANLHNRSRKRAIEAALANMMPRLATAFDTEPDPRAAIAKVAKSDEGPLYDELDWAAGRMATVGNIYDVLRQLDTRTPGLNFFGPLADTAEREALNSYPRMRAIVRDYINEQLNDHYTELEKRLGSLPNKVIVAVAIPMMVGIMITIMGPLVLSLIDQLSHNNPLSPGS